ncbi:hypothetical protein GUJ93_ZPchr0008g12998 [Zizania palustris]|uniref:Uncharacterized protein n=1 Tax=Zizania palustris TaxID=103762 RepID=A0A8J5R4A2_ZIZPA|nr:hypothetical protein GUJ93_ZPchr0008g12998 [Zizania palustris]
MFFSSANPSNPASRRPPWPPKTAKRPPKLLRFLYFVGAGGICAKAINTYRDYGRNRSALPQPQQQRRCLLWKNASAVFFRVLNHSTAIVTWMIINQLQIFAGSFPDAVSKVCIV